MVTAARQGLDHLGASGEVIVNASACACACADDTVEVAAAGAQVVESGPGKGAAIKAGLSASSGDIICLVDGDLRYFGDPPELMAQDFKLVVRHAVERGRIGAETIPLLDIWFEAVHDSMAAYCPGHHDPQAFERRLLEDSLSQLRRLVTASLADSAVSRPAR